MVGHKSEYFFEPTALPLANWNFSLIRYRSQRAHIHEWYTSKAERYVLIGIATELGYEIESWDKDIPY